MGRSWASEGTVNRTVNFRSVVRYITRIRRMRYPLTFRIPFLISPFFLLFLVIRRPSVREVPPCVTLLKTPCRHLYICVCMCVCTKGERYTVTWYDIFIKLYLGRYEICLLCVMDLKTIISHRKGKHRQRKDCNRHY